MSDRFSARPSPYTDIAARKIAAVALKIWKEGETFNAEDSTVSSER